MSVTWSVVQMEYALAQDGKTNVVNNVHWQCIVAENEHFARAYGTVGVPTDDLSNFTEFANLTEAEVVGWVKAALGDEQVSNIETALAANVAEIITPTKGQGLPW